MRHRDDAVQLSTGAAPELRLVVVRADDDGLGRRSGLAHDEVAYLPARRSR
jgi:hypothetical protein